MVKMDRKVPGLVFLLLALALTYRCPLIEGKGEPTLSNAKNYTTTERKALDKVRKRSAGTRFYDCVQIN